MSNRKKIAGVVVLCAIAFAISCRKNKGCWQAFTPFADVPGLLVCDKTKAEAEGAFPQYMFYSAGEMKFCWKVERPPANTFYIRHVPASMVNWAETNWGYSFTRVNCNGFCIWGRIIEKHKSKITGEYGPTRVG